MKGDDAVFIVGLLTLFICLYIVAKYHALAFWWWSEVMDYSQYILDYEAENKRLPGRQRVLRFLNFVQTKNVPISDWINTFYETLSREAGKCYTSTWSGGNAILKRVLEKDIAVPKIGELKSKPVEEKKSTKRDSKRSKKKHTTRIVSDWRKLW